MSVFQKIFSTAKGLIQGNYGMSGGAEILGYTGVDVPPEYLITIEDQRPERYAANAGVKRTVVITAPMQEQISTRTEATWQPLAASSFLGGLGGLAQILTGRTLVSRFTSRQTWSGTSPLDFSLNLKFEAINDVYREVLHPIIELQRMSLPFSGHGVKSENLEGMDFLADLFLAPPGPDPFVIAGKSVRESIPFLKNKLPQGEIYENITVRVGTLLEFQKVIVKDIQIQIQPKFDRNGIPVEAFAMVHFQTFEIVTKETLDNIYKNNTDNGSPTTPAVKVSSTASINARASDILSRLS